MWFRSAVFAVAFVSFSLPAFARGGLSGARKWRELLPTVRATTDCIAQGIVASPTALSHARQDNWLEAVKSMQGDCSDVGRTLIAEHDRLYGPGTGKAFVEGPYASDLPRALKARIGPEMQRQAAQPAKAEVAPAPAAATTETPMQVPAPALLPREPAEAAGEARGRGAERGRSDVSRGGGHREQTAAVLVATPVVLRTADVTAAKPRNQNRLDRPVPPSRAYSLAYLAAFTGAALFATGRALGGRMSGFVR